jgi:hypothetical protein
MKKMSIIITTVILLVAISTTAFAGVESIIGPNNGPGTYGKTTVYFESKGDKKGEVGTDGTIYIPGVGATNLWKPTSSTVSSWGKSIGSVPMDDLRVCNYLRNDLGLLDTEQDQQSNATIAYAACKTISYDSNREYSSDSYHTFVLDGEVRTAWSTDSTLY